MCCLKSQQQLLIVNADTCIVAVNFSSFCLLFTLNKICTVAVGYLHSLEDSKSCGSV